MRIDELDGFPRRVGQQRRLAILANGPSLSDWPLERLTCDVMGVNKSWFQRASEFHVAVEGRQIEWMAEAGARCKTLFTGPGSSSTPAEKVAHHVFEVQPLNRVVGGTPVVGFSSNLAEGAYVRGATYLALQVAVWLGYREIFFFGLDLQPRDGRGHFWQGSHEMAPHMPHVQAEAFGYAAGKLEELGVLAFIVGNSSILTCFPRVPFERVLEQEYVETAEFFCEVGGCLDVVDVRRCAHCERYLCETHRQSHYCISATAT